MPRNIDPDQLLAELEVSYLRDWPTSVRCEHRAVSRLLNRFKNRVTGSLIAAMGSEPFLATAPGKALFNTPVYSTPQLYDDHGWDGTYGIGGFSATDYYLPPGLPGTINQISGATGHAPDYLLVDTERKQVGRARTINFADVARQLVVLASKLVLRYQTSFKRHNTYRSWLSSKYGFAIVERETAVAFNEAIRLILPKNKVTGPRFLSVRHWEHGIGVGRHCGRYALHRRRGRPSLTEREWLRRYRARLAKLNKSGRTMPRRRTKRAPATRFPRGK